MLPLVKLVAEIFIEAGEFDAVDMLLADSCFLYITAKSCKAAFDQIRASISQRHHITYTNSHTTLSHSLSEQNLTQPNLPPTEPKVMLVVEKDKTRTVTEQTRTTKRKQIVLTKADKKPPLLEKKEKEKEKEEKYSTTEKDKQSRKRPSPPATTTQTTPTRTTSATTPKPKQIQWYQWENSKMGIGGFNRESAVVKGERVFRVSKPKRQEAKDV